MSNEQSVPSIWVKGQITNLVVMADNWGVPNPGGLSFLFIYMNELPGTPDGSYNRVAIRGDHPSYNSVLQFAISAVATKSTIALRYIPTTTTHSTAWDFSQLAFDVAN
ncbi:MAG: hypothetical protein Q8900_07735 [Bacillota bacterium]|nr:hypothetical protein [Bacillota bacterium]